MNTHVSTRSVRAWAAAAALILFGWAAGLRAQDLPSSPAFERALGADDLEHDDAKARALYHAVATDANAPDPVRRHAWLRLARLQRRLGEDASAAVAHAAVGDDAVAQAAKALQAELAQDPARHAELEKQAAEAVDRALASENAPWPDLAFFGGAALPAVLRALDRLVGTAGTPRSYSVVRDAQGPADPATRAAFMLWRVPGDAARRAIEVALEGDDVERRRVVAAGWKWTGTTWSEPPAERLDLVRRFLRDRDAVVVRNLLEGLQPATLELVDLLPLALDERGDGRSAALDALLRWSGRYLPGSSNSPQLDRDSRAIGEALPRLLAQATDARAYRSAVQLATNTAMFSMAGRSSLWRALPEIRMSSGVSLRGPGNDFGWEGPAENADLAREVLTKLGPAAPNSAATEIARSLCFQYVNSCWDRSALPTVLAAWRSGYKTDGVDWNPWLDRNARDDDGGEIVTALAGSRALLEALPWLSQHDLPAAAFEALRGEEADDEPHLYHLLRALARTGHPDAVRVILESRRAGGLSTNWAPLAIDALDELAARHRSPELVDGLRGLLLGLGVGVHLSVLAHRTFATLVRLGDANALDFLPRFNKNQGGWGEGGVDVRSVPVGRDWPERSVASPVQWLTLARGRPDGGLEWWHGYSSEQAAAIWRQLLAPRDGGYDAEVWKHAGGALQPLSEARRGTDPRLVRTFVDALRARFTEDGNVTEPATGALQVLLEAVEKGSVGSGDPDLSSAILALRDEAFSAPSLFVRACAVASLTAPFDADERARIVRALGDPDDNVGLAAMRHVDDSDLATDAEVLAAGLRSPAVQTRFSAFATLRNHAPETHLDLLRIALADANVEQRFAAGLELAKTLRLDVVPSLLEALKDPEARVREAATAGLQSIRFYHDEKAYWDRVFDGRAGLTAPSAAAALLDQAKPGSDKDTRLLAIRSLGVLGAPETQPFLITWTKDQDPEIAAAARDAVARIHAK